MCSTLFFPVRYGATLFAVSAAKKGRRILLNPGPTHIMDYDDRCYYIAMSSEEDSHFKVYKEPKQSSVGLLKNRLRHRIDSAITTGSVTFELCTNAVDSGNCFLSFLFKNISVLLSALVKGVS